MRLGAGEEIVEEISILEPSDILETRGGEEILWRVVLVSMRIQF